MSSRSGRPDNKKRVLHVGSYEVGKTLGNGSFGKVKLGTNVFTKEKVAIKFFNHRRFATTQQVENTQREIEIMKLLSHPNIVKLIDVIEKTDECTTYLIAEYVSGGELFDYIVANGTVKEKQARHFLRQIVSAVEFCHANLIVHRDLKPENLLLDANGNIKISDFGLSNMIEPGKLLDSFCGSPLYAAPEILLAERYVGPPIDVWSIGVILYALLCGHLPWNGDSQAEISHNSIKGIYDEPHDISAPARDLISKMLNPSPKARITIAEMRKHEWMNEGYTDLPASLITLRQPVFEVQDEIVTQLVSLGFKNEDEIRKQILDNECCQVVAMYHLILDRKVAQEMAEVKKAMLGNNRPTPAPSHPSSSPMKIPASKVSNMKAKPAAFLHNSSPLRAASALTAIVEEEANEMSAAEWSKIQQSDVEEHSEVHQHSAPDSVSANTSRNESPNYHHQHDSPQHQHDAVRLSSSAGLPAPSPRLSHSGGLQPPRLATGPSHSPRLSTSATPHSPRTADPSWSHEQRGEPRSPQHAGNQQQQRQPQQRGGRSQLSTSVCLGAVDRGKQRRFSVIAASDQMVHNRSLPQTSEEFGHANQAHPRNQHHRKDPQQQPSDPAPPPAPRGRKFSLDSRAIADLQQMSQEHGGQQQHQPQGPGGVRNVKGVFKSATTTTRPPCEAAKLVKEALDNAPFFTKRKSPYVFECFDDETGVRFSLEVCRIPQLDMTGIHLKRLVGDIWAYKTLCSSFVNKLSL